jgi:hypothetical protein
MERSISADGLLEKKRWPIHPRANANRDSREAALLSSARMLRAPPREIVIDILSATIDKTDIREA